MRRNPERVAWTTLLSAFFIFCALITLVPLGGWWWLRNATAVQTITMTSTGALLVTRPGHNTPEAQLTSIPVGSVVFANAADAQAVLNFASPRGEVLASLQIYGQTVVIIEQADTPRYRTGIYPHRIQLEVATGRVRVRISQEVSRPVQVVVTSAPKVTALIEMPGSNASFETTFTQSIVTVREGEATLTLPNAQVNLTKDQRAEVEAGGLRGPLPAERNLITNGDFQQPLEVGWTPDIRKPCDPNESPGVVEVVTSAGQHAVHFSRFGVNCGQAGITQELNKDVRDFKTLKLHLVVLVSQQDLWNCGAAGTECPVMLSLKYVQPDGGQWEWLKGFYYKFNSNPSFGPTYCPFCAAVNDEHQLVPVNQAFPYDSEDLLELLKKAGHPAATIKSISIYGAGHTFDGQVTEVQLLASE